MKKIVSIIVLLALLFTACSCGSPSTEESTDTSDKQNKDIPEEKVDPINDLYGEWIYNTGFTKWHFIFKDDGTCEFYSGVNETEESTYEISEEQHIKILDLNNWDFYYTVEDDMHIRLFHTQDSYDDWEFVKDPLYDPNEQHDSLMLTSDMVDKIIEEFSAPIFPTMVCAYEGILFKDYGLKFTKCDITNHKKTDQYTYTVYGILYAVDDYNKNYQQEVNIIFTCIEDSEKTEGYKTHWSVKMVE